MSKTTTYTGPISDAVMRSIDAHLLAAKRIADPLIRGDKPWLQTSSEPALLYGYSQASSVIDALSPYLDELEGDDLLNHSYVNRFADAYNYAIACLHTARKEVPGIKYSRTKSPLFRDAHDLLVLRKQNLSERMCRHLVS